MPLTKELNIAIIDSNPALMAQKCIRQEDPPDSRVSTVTPATISFFKGRIIPEVVVMLNFYIACL